MAKYTKKDALRDAKKDLQLKGFVIIIEMDKETKHPTDEYRGVTICIKNPATNQSRHFYLNYGIEQYIGILHGLIVGFDII